MVVNDACAVRTDEQYRLECEAKHWISEVKTKGRKWWDQDKQPRLTKIRGFNAMTLLRKEMNRQARR